jgi:hypothetical protein
MNGKEAFNIPENELSFDSTLKADYKRNASSQRVSKALTMGYQSRITFLLLVLTFQIMFYIRGKSKISLF